MKTINMIIFFVGIIALGIGAYFLYNFAKKEYIQYRMAEKGTAVGEKVFDVVGDVAGAPAKGLGKIFK